MNDFTEILHIEGLSVSVEVTINMHIVPNSISYVAKCGKTTLKHSFTLHRKDDRIMEHIHQGHDRELKKIASEVASHEKTRLLLNKFKELKLG